MSPALALSLALLAAQPPVPPLVGPPDSEPHVRVAKEFVDDFAEARRQNAPLAEVNRLARTGNVVVPSIHLHPVARGDSIVAYPGVAIPACAPGQRAFVLFRIGISDGIPWDHALKPNGVRFSAGVNGEVLFQEDVAEGGWRLRALEVTRWAGQAATVDFRTNAIDGHVSYDWALFGRPQLVHFAPARSPLPLGPGVPGLALAQVRCKEPARVTLAMAAAVERASLAPGTHWLPLRFQSAADPALRVESGAAELVRVEAAPLPYRLEVRGLQPASPLVTAGHRFEVLLSLENTGEGAYTGGGRALLTTGRPLGGLGTAGRSAAIGPVAPGACKVVRWMGLAGATPGEWVLRCQVGQGTLSLPLRVQPAAPPTPPNSGGLPGPAPPTPPNSGGLPGSAPPTPPNSGGLPAGASAVVGNAWSRLRFVLAPGSDGYAFAETWNGKAWQRVGSLYPLARVVVRSATGQREELPVRIQRASTRRGTLVLDGVAGGPASPLPPNSGGLHESAPLTPPSSGGQGGPTPSPWPLRITYRPEARAPRIHVTCELQAPEGAQLLALQGPALLAGDRAYGAGKDFAIFPGLEYLEGDEESSSRRDLAPPLHDRRVPHANKIATPLMAVQAQGTLAALLWDANQEWAPGERHPAARFLAPNAQSGLTQSHLSLFAPSVGKYVEENTYEASTPYPIAKGGRIRLQACLVLDHRARYGRGSTVRGPHRGGLVLQAMRHWFDVYGLPEPSPQPRPWDAERALCREGYLKTLWSEDPPGWPGIAGAPVGTDTEPFVSLLLELHAGVDAETGQALRQKMARVGGYVLEKAGPGALLNGNRVLLPFHYGHLAETLALYRSQALGMLAGRENGLWVWRPGDAEHAALGIPGTHTLGQATYASLVALRAARFTGDPQLTAQALEAMRQMERYEVPRGASMWECPQYQPDIFAAALAIKVYCEAYRLTGDRKHLEHARYWAWTGLPFLYTWSLDGYPTMRYNSIGVIGSTYYTHSWLGRPVVWMGLDYAYALQDLWEVDRSLPWRRIAQGITNSAMWQQYTEGKSKGLFPDSWEMAKNTANPADIGPLLILLNEHRLRGRSLEVRHARFEGPGGPVRLNAGADILSPSGSLREGRVSFRLRGVPGFAAHAVLAPVPEPRDVAGAGERAAGSGELQSAPAGWLYDAGLKAVILKQAPDSASRISMRW